MTLDLFAPKKHAPTLHHGDCLTVLRTMPDASVDAVVTDPPYLIDFMGKGWDSADGIAGKPEVWAECLRVLKPGGHLLAFGATRTYHRITCAIEDAGFEIRDSIHWMYGSGFPKSLDVSKALDSAAGAEREVVGKSAYAARANKTPRAIEPMGGVRYSLDTRDITAPATDLAKQWDGWGTALKPAFEPVVVAAKPATIGSCLSQLSARVAAECSKSNPSAFVVAFASALRSVVPTFATQVDSSEATATSQYESDKTLSWNTVSSWQSTWAEVLAAENTFIIETETRLTTDLRTLLSCLSRITGANTFVRESEFSSLVQLAASLFLASTHRLNAIRTLAAIESATAKSLTSSPDADASGPHEPVVVARKPLAGTVAANVERYGTGALNIDASRVGTTVETWPATKSYGAGAMHPGGKGTTQKTGPVPPGRWPPNLLLSHTEDCTESACDETCAVAELDRQSGTLKSGERNPSHSRNVPRLGGSTYGKGVGGACPRVWEADSGGASRFFPVFRYQAKASRSEREAGLSDLPSFGAKAIMGRDPASAGAQNPRAGAGRGAGAPTQICEKCRLDMSGGSRKLQPCREGGEHAIVDGPTQPSVKNLHPTVKPVALMEWLVTLVTPSGGVVLDPFMGSGTTGVAAVRKGFRFVGIEREDEYLAIARARIEAA